MSLATTTTLTSGFFTRPTTRPHGFGCITSGLLLFCLLASLAAASPAPLGHVTVDSQSDRFPAVARAPTASSSGPKFSYHVAASYTSKKEYEFQEANLFTRDLYRNKITTSKNLKKCYGALDKAKRPNTGEDAFFFSQINTSGGVAFGVADGVGGWARSGISADEYAHSLCEYMTCAAQSWPNAAKTPADPKQLLDMGYKAVQLNKDIVGGSSTACLAVAVADADGHIQVANLGDSGFLHIRLNAIQQVTKVQTHTFNTPFQLAKIPPTMKETDVYNDKPSEAQVTKHTVKHGDVLIIASDGVLDNLSPEEIRDMVVKNMESVGAMQKGGSSSPTVGTQLHSAVQAGRKADKNSLQAKIALEITKTAKEFGWDSRRDGPFAKEFQQVNPGRKFHGGKPDDTTVVVAIVEQN